MSKTRYGNQKEKEKIIRQLIAKFKGKTFSNNEGVIEFLKKILSIAYINGAVDEKIEILKTLQHECGFDRAKNLIR